MASIIAFGRPSHHEGNTNTSASARAFSTAGPSRTIADISRVLWLTEPPFLDSAAPQTTQALLIGPRTQLMVAKGECDAYFEEQVMLWDVAGGLAIVSGAGGWCDATGTDMRAPYVVFASNAQVQLENTRLGI